MYMHVLVFISGSSSTGAAYREYVPVWVLLRSTRIMRTQPDFARSYYYPTYYRRPTAALQQYLSSGLSGAVPGELQHSVGWDSAMCDGRSAKYQQGISKRASYEKQACMHYGVLWKTHRTQTTITASGTRSTARCQGWGFSLSVKVTDSSPGDERHAPPMTCGLIRVRVLLKLRPFL